MDHVIWSGFRPDFSWIDLPVFGDEQEPNEPIHHRGIVAGQPGFYWSPPCSSGSSGSSIDPLGARRYLPAAPQPRLCEPRCAD